MNKERAKEEIIATRKTFADKKQKLEEKNEFEKSELKRRENKSFIHLYDNKINALDIAIESLQEDKFVLLQCTDGRIFVVDSKKSIDDLESESCKKCKQIDELKEIRMENKIFTENYFKELEPYERKE